MQKHKIGDIVYTKYVAWSKDDIEIFPHSLWTSKIINYQPELNDTPYLIKWVHQKKYQDTNVSKDIIFEKKQIVIDKNVQRIEKMWDLKKQSIKMDKIILTNKNNCKKILRMYDKLIKTNGNFWKIPVDNNKTINKILTKYEIYSIKTFKHKNKEFIQEINKIIKSKFNELLHLKLLYKKERIKFNQQYCDKPVTFDYCNIFGLQHLYRLIITLPEVIYFKEKKQLELFQDEIYILLEFLETYDIL